MILEIKLRRVINFALLFTVRFPGNILLLLLLLISLSAYLFLGKTAEQERHIMGAVCCGGDDADGGANPGKKQKKSKSKGSTGNRLGGSGSGDDSGMSAREKAAAAAEKRSEDAMGGNTEQKNRIERDRYIGRIEALYATKHKDPPFGLRAASLAALKKHLETAKNL